MGEEEERLITITALSVAVAKGVWCYQSVCVYVHARGVKQAVGGCLTPFLLLRPRGITRCLYCIFAPHDLQIFSF